jgi:hypothetical protein
LDKEIVFWGNFDSDKGIQEILNDLAAGLREKYDKSAVSSLINTTFIL